MYCFSLIIGDIRTDPLHSVYRQLEGGDVFLQSSVASVAYARIDKDVHALHDRVYLKSHNIVV